MLFMEFMNRKFWKFRKPCVCTSAWFIRSVVALLSAMPVFLFCFVDVPVASVPWQSACLKYAFIQQRRALSPELGRVYRRPRQKRKWRVAPLKATAAAWHFEWRKCKKKRRENERKGRRRKRKGNSGCLFFNLVNGKKQKLQHPDFARGPPPHYYPGQNVLNFADQTGCGALTIVWP